MRDKLFMTRYYSGVVKPVLTRLALAIALAPVPGWAENYFNPAFLSDDPSAVADLSTFSRNAQAAGVYRVDIYLNNTFIATKDIAFQAVKTAGKSAPTDDSGLRVCLTPEMLKNMGVNTGAFPQLAKAAAGSCPDLASAIPVARTRFDFAQQRLDISIPQAAMIASARGYIPPQYWDEGINALLMNYTFTGANSRDRSADGSAENSYFLGLNSGLNLGAWRLRDYSTWNANSGDQNSDSNWQHISTYLERDMGFLQGELTAGDSYTPTAASGDLTVEVKESDGSINRYNVPYSAVPILQREGRLKYAATVAEYRGDSSQKEKVKFSQATLIWGLAHGFTLYGGTQLSSKYHALAIGSGANLGDWGAVSLDVTQAASTLADNSTHQGQSLRFLYAKSLAQTGTHLQLMGYRYSTSGFYTLDDTAWKQMSGYDDDDRTDNDKSRPEWADYYNLYYTRRGKVQLDINQQLGGLGSLFITGSQQSYWHTDEKDSLLQVGYSDTLAGIAWSISYNNNKSSGDAKRDQIFALNISVPLSQWLQHDDEVTRHHNVYATFSTSTDKQHNVTQNAGLNGTLLDENNLSYNIQQSYQNHGIGESGAASLEYDGAKGNANIGYNVSDNGDYQQVNYGLSGGLVAHAHGLTLSQPLGNTNILIAAPGAANVGVVDQPGIHTDARGYAVVPYATTYRQNRMALDINAMADDVDIDDAVTRVVPTEGALVLARFKARVGARALLTLNHNGKPVPFGATVTVNDRHAEAIVDEAGELYLSGLSAQGVLHVRWGDLPDQQCVAHYHLSSSRQILSRQHAECH
ncbi:fimbria/pilus outer membrane usher protein [Salmonella enterica subsp. enterica]|nr:fimbria/pilus outer membrane usher protein [Salmonella enterica subsp. enterica]